MDDAERQMHDQARRLADLHLRKLRDAGQGPIVWATVATYTAGPPRVVTLVIRDPTTPITAQWINAAYTPVVGDRVLCLTDGNQLAVIGAGG